VYQADTKEVCRPQQIEGGVPKCYAALIVVTASYDVLA
jgi:hypothetical protein